MVFKLKEIKDPQFQLEVAEGDVRSYDPWEVQEKIQASLKDNADIYAAIRSAFGIPELSRNGCLVVQDELLKFIEGLPVSKNALSRTRA